MMEPSRLNSSPPPHDGEHPALYTARVDNVDGTSGEVHVHDGPESLTTADTPHLALPTGDPAAPQRGFTPEQFLAMAWSTCLGETLRVVLAERDLKCESRVSVEVELRRDPGGGYRFVPRAIVTIDGLGPEESRALADAAHARCPVSKLLSGTGTSLVEVRTSADPT